MNTLLEVFFEFLSLFLYVLAGLLGYLFPFTQINNEATKATPIVFVHGWLTQNPLYFFFKSYLEKHGYRVYMTSFGLQAGDFTIYTKKLSEYIYKKKLNQVVLIGVSGGALIAFDYLQRQDGWKRVSKFVSIGIPLKGTFLAICCFFLKSARQMTPKSVYLKDLLAEKVKNPDKILCISAKYDELVPQYSSHIPKAKNEIVDIIGHVHLQAFSRKTWVLTMEFVES